MKCEIEDVTKGLILSFYDMKCEIEYVTKGLTLSFYDIYGENWWYHSVYYSVNLGNVPDCLRL